MSAVPPPADGHSVEDLPPDSRRGLNHHAPPARGEQHAVRVDARWARPRPHSHDRQQQQVDDDGGTAEEPELDDCKRMGTLFGMINKCLLGLGFSQMSFGDRTVEPVVILIFWLLLWFLGFQALGLVGTLCLIIIYIQK
ncbi:uncharacterized protein FAM241A [Kryptolebias marmoratus]|uniref:uncharacterized protein FAM241A n=1 Tax=Kryptolebias marmoratus TaxID=37003 RepID=UPI0007F8AA63|nr:uncharacterized protein FAM241A [Kryptolebias marmoratus]